MSINNFNYSLSDPFTFASCGALQTLQDKQIRDKVKKSTDRTWQALKNSRDMVDKFYLLMTPIVTKLFLISPKSRISQFNLFIYCSLSFRSLLTLKNRVHFEKNACGLKKIKNRDVALILQTTCDHNGAFKIKRSALNFFKQIEQAHYAPVFYKVSSQKEIAQKIDETIKQGNRIKLLIFRAHGSYASMDLSEKKQIDVNNVRHLKKSFKKLDPDAVIVLESCSTAANPSPYSQNFAQALSRVANRKVFAGNDVVRGVKMTNAHPLEFQLFKAGSLFFNKQDVTAVYKP